MTKLMPNIPKKEEQKEEQEEKKDLIFEEEEEEEKQNIEIVIEPVEKPEEKPKKRSRKMTPEAQEGLKKAREQSLLKRQENARKRKEKQENEIEDKISKKYINEIDDLKKKLYQYENTPPKEIIKEKEVVIKQPNIEEVDRFSMDDLELYSEMKIKKLKEMEAETKLKNREFIKNRFMMNLR
jgi:hypothetical protein